MGPGRAEGTDAGVAGIRQHMDVIASCGTKIGVVDRVEGNSIKLTKDSSKDGACARRSSSGGAHRKRPTR